MPFRRRRFWCWFGLVLLAACGGDRIAVASDGVETSPAPAANRAEAQAIAARFDALALQLEAMTLPPQSLTGAERRGLRADLSYLLAYLEAPSWREERIVQLERRIAKIETDRTGVYSGDAQEFTRQWEASGREIDRLRADVRALRSAPAGEGATEDASPAIVLPSSAERAAAPSQSRADVIGEMERLLTPPGRLRPRDKQVLRGRMDALVAFIDAPTTRAEEIDELKNQLAALQRFHLIGPVEGSNELYDRYRQAVDAEAERLRDRIRRLEAGD